MRAVQARRLAPQVPPVLADDHEAPVPDHAALGQLDAVRMQQAEALDGRDRDAGDVAGAGAIAAEYTEIRPTFDVRSFSTATVRGRTSVALRHRARHDLQIHTRAAVCRRTPTCAAGRRGRPRGRRGASSTGARPGPEHASLEHEDVLVRADAVRGRVRAPPGGSSSSYSSSSAASTVMLRTRRPLTTESLMSSPSPRRTTCTLLGRAARAARRGRRRARRRGRAASRAAGCRGRLDLRERRLGDARARRELGGGQSAILRAAGARCRASAAASPLSACVPSSTCSVFRSE